MRSLVALILIVAVIAGAGYYFTKVDPILGYIPKGLDLQGGTHLIFQGVETPEGKVTSEAMARVKEIIRHRVDGLGVSEPNIQLQGKDRIIVDLAGVKDPEAALRIVGRTAILKFVDPEGNIVINGPQLKDARAVINGNEAVIAFELKDEEAKKKFADATEKYLGQRIAVYLDDQILTNPQVNAIIPNGRGEITGYETLQEAEAMANLLRGGALPVKLELIENRTVSASLGTDSIKTSVTAGIIGSLAVLLFVLGYYRLPGLIANLALIIYVFLVLGSMAAIRQVLTLPGIAGIILSIGMAVDANVLIYERIKEELRAGKTLRSGIDSGFHRALTTILDSNLTTLIAAAILFYIGSGPIRGFAVTLAIGVILSMFTAITVTRILLRLLVGTGMVGKSIFGVRG